MRPTREQDLAIILNLIRLVHQEVRDGADALHAATGTNASQRAILGLLIDNDAMSVPDLAREQGVSRQHVQLLCDGLVARGLVFWRDNPAHKRSKLAAISDDGWKLIDQARLRESRAVLSLAGTFSASALEVTRSTLEALLRKL